LSALGALASGKLRPVIATPRHPAWRLRENDFPRRKPRLTLPAAI
jgi:hypothetical protein